MTLYAIGDIQGCSSALDALLDAIGFAPGRDRLWLVGDLVNRGPDSLGVLRRVIDLGDAVTCVLGNHDLHLLAAAAGTRPIGSGDTFQSVLDAPDRGALIDWLRARPLIHHDSAAGRVLVHAGIPPQWTLSTALEQAGEVSRLLRGREWREMLATMYGSEPRRWSQALRPEERRRFTINALTRMRFCTPDGSLDLMHTGPPGSQPAPLIPWYDVAGRPAAEQHIVFGHWAALGFMRRTDVTALDSGCVWGGALTALPLEPSGEPVRVSCAGGKAKASAG